MAYAGWLGRGAACVVSGLALAVTLGAQEPVLAQQPAKGAKQQSGAPAKGPPAAQQKQQQQQQQSASQSAWVKLCEQLELQRKDKDGKEVKEQKKLCLTQHEQLDRDTGLVLVSVAIREIEGLDKPQLMTMVPIAAAPAIPPGVRAVVYSKEQWDKAQKNEKIEEKDLKFVDLKYVVCHPAGCTAEAEATKEIVEAMKGGAVFLVLAFNAAAKPVRLPVPLDGFATALAGAPADTKAYAEARSQAIQQIRQRQADLLKQYQEQQQQQQAAGNAPAPAAGAQPPAKK
jgi:invasion protein IalB